MFITIITIIIMTIAMNMTMTITSTITSTIAITIIITIIIILLYPQYLALFTGTRTTIEPVPPHTKGQAEKNNYRYVHKQTTVSVRGRSGKR